MKTLKGYLSQMLTVRTVHFHWLLFLIALQHVLFVRCGQGSTCTLICWHSSDTVCYLMWEKLKFHPWVTPAWYCDRIVHSLAKAFEQTRASRLLSVYRRVQNSAKEHILCLRGLTNRFESRWKVCQASHLAFLWALGARQKQRAEERVEACCLGGSLQRDIWLGDKSTVPLLPESKYQLQPKIIITSLLLTLSFCWCILPTTSLVFLLRNLNVACLLCSFFFFLAFFSC